jgi:hypothetical protein
MYTRVAGKSEKIKAIPEVYPHRRFLATGG